MAKTDDSAVEQAPEVDAPVTDEPVKAVIDEIEEPTREEVKAKEEELASARETDDPNDDLDAARPDEGTPVSVPDALIEVEPPEEPTVDLVVADNFKIPVLEEYTDEQGRPRGRVAGYEAPDDLKVSLSSFDAEADYVDEDGYVTLPATVPASVAAELTDNPAVEVVS